MTAGREAAIAAFLAGAGWGRAERRLLAADASFRRYDRLRLSAVSGPGATAVLMDAPPEQEKPAAFRQVSELLLKLGLSAPRVLASDLERGFLLLEDFGDLTFTRALAQGAEEAALYALAVDTLVALHRRWRPDLAAGLKPYGEAALLTEVMLLPEWFLPAVRGRASEPALTRGYLAAWRALLREAEGLAPVLVLRDFHVDNLMVLPGRSGIARCGLLDFQDALLGSPAYDLVSLLRDARRDLSPGLAETMFARYRAALPELDGGALERAYWFLGAQRSAKIIGIFTRLARRDSKAAYLKHLPRVWRLLEEELRQPALAPLKAWFDREVPPELRRAPDLETLQ